MSEYPDGYEAALKHALEIEGSPTNYSWDPGGATAFGIAKTYWPEYWKNGPPTYEVARVFYFKEFWTPLRLSEIKDQRLRLEIFDAAVNCGHTNAVRFAQRAYNLLRPRGWAVLRLKNGSPGADGDMGPATLAALNRMTIRYTDALLGGCNYYQAMYYEGRNEELREEAIRGWFGKRLTWTPSK